MTHLFIHAVAGAGKTERIVRTCANPEKPKKRLVITLTQSGQEELSSRLSAACAAEQLPDVIGWYTFLIRHYVRPYLPNLFDDVRPTGFVFDSDPSKLRYLNGKQRHFSPDGSIYKDTLAELAIKVAELSNGAVENRLSCIYDEVIIDEVQDIGRKSLDVIDRLLKCGHPRIVMLGDVRQSLIDSDRMSSKNKGVDRLRLISWYQEHKKARRLTIEEMNSTRRSNQAVASFSDAIFPAELGLAETESVNQVVTRHDGVFLVLEEHLDEYLQRYDAVPLRNSVNSGNHLDHLGFTNIGLVKGLTFDRVIIYPTKPILDLIATGTALPEKSACSFYVGVTRARASVAIIVDSKRMSPRLRENPTLPIVLWSPSKVSKL